MNKPLATVDSLRKNTMRIHLPANLGKFFAPNRVAVIGASSKNGNQGGRIMKSLEAQGFPGEIIAVHPEGGAVYGHNTVRSVTDLPMGMELAIAAVPATNVPSLVEPLSERGIRHLIVISGGFSETNEKGTELQEKLQLAGKQFGVRIIGPNAMGVFSGPDHFNSFFTTPGELALPQPGPIAIASQSGAFMLLLLDRLSGLGIGVNQAVNFGNRVDVGENDLLELWEDDPKIKVIGLYLESVQNGKRFIEIARKVGLKKPVVIWKGGHFSRGTDAARAHSASLAGSYDVFQAACAKSGLIEVNGFEEFSNTLMALASQPPALGNRALVVSNGGGMGVFLTDLCECNGLVVPETPQILQTDLLSRLPAYFSYRNPIDLTGSGTNEQCVHVVECLLKSREYDGLLMVLLAGTAGITSDIVSLMHDRLPADLPKVVAAYGTMASQFRKSFSKAEIPVFDSAEAATQAFNILVKAGKMMRQHAFPVFEGEPMYHPDPVKGWSGWPKNSPDEMEFKHLLKVCGVLVPVNQHLKTTMDLDRAIDRLGFPMTLKVAGNEIKHKTELKGLRLHITTKNDLLREWEVMSHQWPGKIWAEEEMHPGLDLMIGAHKDTQFGSILVFGSGGQHVELIKDIQRMILPAENEELYQMIFNTKAGTILRGVRGQGPLDLKRLMDFIKLVADWIMEEPRIESLDFNPVRLYDHGLVALDAKVTLYSKNEG
jgi:acyl-CoA synthetase (NDP forming)